MYLTPMQPINFSYFARFAWLRPAVCISILAMVCCAAPANAQKTVFKQLIKKQAASTPAKAPVRRFYPSQVEQKRLQKELARQKRINTWVMHRHSRSHTHKLAAQRYMAAQKSTPLTEKEIALLAKQFHVPKLRNTPPVIIEDFSSFMPPVQLPAPYPLSLYPGDLARGMLLLNPKEDLQTIFSKGLLTARSAVDGWTKKRLIFMTNVPQIAHIYTCPQEPGVPVIVHIAGFKGENKHIWTTSHDIPAKNIVRVSAYLNINGKNRWGQIMPLKEGGFAFYPYQLSFAQKAKLNLLRALQRPSSK